MTKVIPSASFNRSAVSVSRELIGCYLVRRMRGRTSRFLITETEAYEGFADKASHASRGKTPRNAVMFGKPGIFYIYLVYGMHWMLNVVTGREGHPSAVLIRGVEGYSGPGKVTKALKVSRILNGKSASRKIGLWFEKGRKKPLNKILKTPRIGVAYAGEIWSKKLYRFVLKREEPRTNKLSEALNSN